MNPDRFSTTLHSLFDTEYAHLVLNALDRTTGVVITDSSGNTLTHNEKFFELASSQNLEKSSIISCIHSIIEKKDIWHDEFCFKKSDNTIQCIDITVVPKLDKNKNITYYTSICFDITDRKIAEEHLLANKNMLQAALSVDPLTGIANRNAFTTHIRNILEQKSQDQLACVAMIDIDFFKKANDALGHKAGDKLLKKVAQILKSYQNDNIIIARVGGDEFSVVIIGKSENYFREILENILHSLDFLFSFNGITHRCTVSIGYTLTKPMHQNSISDALHPADLALYHAKSIGKNCIYAYNADLHTKHENRLQLRSSIMQSLKNNEFFVKYQPIISLKTKEFFALDTLLQWPNKIKKHTVLSMNDANIYSTLHDFSIMNTIRDSDAFNMSHDHKTRIALHIDHKGIFNSHLIEKIILEMSTQCIDPSHVFIEIHVDALQGKKTKSYINDLNQLKENGFSIALRGFSKEQTPLNLLREYNYDYIKIDKSLIQSLTQSSLDCVIVKSIIDTAHTMEQFVVADGVDTIACAQILTDFECDFVQGDLYFPPMSVPQIIQTLSPSPHTPSRTAFASDASAQ